VQLADLIRLHEDEIRAKDVQHEADRLQRWVDSNIKSTTSVEKGTEENSSMLTELRTQIDAVKEQLSSSTQLNVDLREQIFML
jgi:ribosomal protein S20